MLDDLLEQATGFPQCGRCTFRDTGFPALCYQCASDDLNPPDDERCMTCDQSLRSDGTCANYWCRQDVSSRYFDTVWAIAKNTGPLRQKIHAFKYEGKYGWAVIFGRILVGYLDDLQDSFESFDVITSMPFFADLPDRYDHMRRVLKAADIEAGGRWPFDIDNRPVIVKTKATPRMVNLSLNERRTIARTDIRAALSVPQPDRVSGKSVLVLDDVFTEGSTLREVARALKDAGATAVCGVVLARHPWQT